MQLPSVLSSLPPKVQVPQIPPGQLPRIRLIILVLPVVYRLSLVLDPAQLQCLATFLDQVTQHVLTNIRNSGSDAYTMLREERTDTSLNFLEGLKP